VHPYTVSHMRRRFRRQQDEDESQPERRCFYGWVIWVVLTVGQVTTFFGTSSGITFIVDDLMAELGLSRTSLSLAYSVGTIGGALVQQPIGRAVDRFGGRVSITVCSAAYAASLIGISLPRSWATLAAALLFLRALGFGGLALSCTTCLQQWFVRRRGLATGCQEAGTSLVGFGCFSAVLAAMIRAHGWRRAYQLTGLGVLAYAPLAALLLRSRPEDIGLLPDGKAPPPQSSPEGAPASLSSPAPPASKPTIEGWTLREAQRTLAFWLVVASNALQWGMGAGFFLHLASISEELGMPASQLPGCFYLPWSVARATSLILGGWMLDRHEPHRILCLGFLCGSLSLATMGLIDMVAGYHLTPGLTVPVATFYGLSMGLCASVFKIVSSPAALPAPQNSAWSPARAPVPPSCASRSLPEPPPTLLWTNHRPPHATLGGGTSAPYR
jgi:sugar phosphate permease